jgi:hypothetical protein
LRVDDVTGVSGFWQAVPTGWGVLSAAEPAESRENLLALIAVLREKNVVLTERCTELSTITILA